MQPSKRRQLKLNFTAVMLSLSLAAVVLWCSLPILHAQSAGGNSDTNAPPPSPAAGLAVSVAPPDAAASTNAPGTAAAATNAPGTAPASTNSPAPASASTNAPGTAAAS